ncbi:MAG: branched-chain amino acid ABC transporter permease [Alphaproteobacteria bacterium]|jgi:branched-chain amino acid transport system permease protein|nr:branched-chain amino acid ABC transporter permease [Alphaproteobacteria bacterium]MBT4084636.1 branched-chain amino acid ABC transporter permease [Alphaproteobacteria bacterium]MBT4543612.1 branched-chain amino acid ABC transporter permease [Alphaproteobacteria bacterium]MBT6385953.1 branched-chain amino acid ABC transporter permease [Alphaproteobacteria bacterium]MBT7743765.1 branched-chain amino acid ABC transporter permease [Alphaproteobacteria bacterium]
MMQFIADGILNASLIALGALGLSMTYNVLRFANFAQGEVLAIGAYFALGAVTVIGAGVGVMGPIKFGWPLLVSIPIAIVCTSIVVLMVDYLVFRPLRNSNASRITLIMAAFGLSLMGRNLIHLFAGGDPKYFSFYIPKAIEIMPGVKMVPDDLAIIALSAIAVVSLHLFLKRTNMGRMMRAVSENPTLARINGIDLKMIIRMTWIIGTALAVTAGTLQGHIFQAKAEMGFDMLLPMFAALILGGVGNLYGTVLGALVIGLAESFAVYFDLSAYRAAVSFMIMLAVLLVRPQGLLGERE